MACDRPWSRITRDEPQAYIRSDTAGFVHGFTDTAPSTNSSVATTWVSLLATLPQTLPGRLCKGRLHSSPGHTPISPSIFLSGTGNGQATGVNNSGVVCGFYVDSAGGNHGFLLSNGVLTTLNYPGSIFTQALGLNNSNQVVGAFMDAQGNGHGFLYNSQYGIYQQIDDPLAVPPAGTVANGINNAGDTVGFYVNDLANTDGFVATPSATCSTASPAALSFGTVPAGETSIPQPVTVTNCASTPTVITKYLFTAPYVFNETNTCPVSPTALPSKVSCTVYVMFKPTSISAVTGCLMGVPLFAGEFIRLTGN